MLLMFTVLEIMSDDYMKKILFTIFILLLLSGCTKLPRVGGGTTINDISATSLATKYNQATAVKSKYQLNGSSLKMTPKADPKDKIEVTVGDEPTPGLLGGSGDFNPKVKISRWGEVSLSLTPTDLDKVATKDKTLDLSNGKIKVGTPKADYQIYDLPVDQNNPEGGLEYEIDLKSKPASNVIQFQLDTQGLDFFYQPALTQEEIAEGAVRPENVVGSYAVYASEQKTNWEGGKVYGTGKVGHIFRPKITDLAGTEVWGILNVDIKAGILSVTIPQEFLDNAVYPVRHAAGLTFGYGSVGVNQNTSQNQIIESYRFTGAEGTLTSITAWSKDVGLNDPIAVYGLYDTSYNFVTGSGSNQVTLTSDAGAWATSTVSSSPTISAVDYFVAWWTNKAGFIAWDTGTTNYEMYKYPGAVWPTWPATLSPSLYNRKYSIYATYTASAPAITVGNNAIQIKNSQVKIQNSQVKIKY
jgi:hypothetical protein